MSTWILLPPSEGKRAGGSGEWDPGTDDLGQARRAVAHALGTFARRASVADLAKLFGVGGAHLEHARAVARAGFVGAPVLPAAERFSGVVWDHLDLASLPAPARRHAERHVLVVSALAGIVAAGEPVPDHRLKMSAALPRLGRLAPWWQPRLAPIVAGRVARHTVVDLLPNEHAAALDPTGLARRVVRVRFVRSDGAAAAGHGAKAAKGLLARALVAARTADPVEVCREFADGGFAFVDVVTDDTVATVRIAAVGP